MRCANARTILYNSSSLTKPYFVKPDLSPEQRKRDQALLKVRWSLIQEGGVSRSSIKIRKSAIFVDKVKHGSLDHDLNFIPSSTVTTPPSPFHSPVVTAVLDSDPAAATTSSSPVSSAAGGL